MRICGFKDVEIKTHNQRERGNGCVKHERRVGEREREKERERERG